MVNESNNHVQESLLAGDFYTRGSSNRGVAYLSFQLKNVALTLIFNLLEQIVYKNNVKAVGKKEESENKEDKNKMKSRWKRIRNQGWNL
ncbi:5953_t:CDS:2, partial [Entrophospora sp. SA101]